MNIERINSYYVSNQLNGKKETARKTEEKGKPPTTDRLELSEEARRLHDGTSMTELAKAKLKEIPEIRQAKVEEIKGKVASQYYNNDQVVARIADKLASSPDLVSALAGQNRQAARANPEELKKLTVVMNRVDRNIYDSIEVLDKVAGRILKDLHGET